MITIITPTYNRAYILPKLYESLCAQTVKLFEWILIDDGSSDNTETLISNWINKTNQFQIIYRKRENGGKHRALNDAFNIAKYDWCFIVDSDDYLTTNAVEKIIHWIKTVDGDNSFAGISGLKGLISNDKPIGGMPKIKKDNQYIDATNLQRNKFGLNGDKAEIYKTEILKKYPFPEFAGEKFVTEAVVWDAIASDGYKLRWFNEIIYMCEYIDDGLTKQGDKKFIDNFQGFTYYTRMRMKLHGWVAKQSAIINYFRIAKIKGIDLKEIKKNLNISIIQVYFALYLLKPLKRLLKLILNVRRRK